MDLHDGAEVTTAEPAGRSVARQDDYVEECRRGALARVQPKT